MVNERSGKISSGCFAQVFYHLEDEPNHCLTLLLTPTVQGHVLGMDIKEGLTWYLEKIHWDQAATGEGGIAAGMQRELRRECPGGIPGGQPALPDGLFQSLPWRHEPPPPQN